jgi:hypothetical protein
LPLAAGLLGRRLLYFRCLLILRWRGWVNKLSTQFFYTLVDILSELFKLSSEGGISGSLGFRKFLVKSLYNVFFVRRNNCTLTYKRKGVGVVLTRSIPKYEDEVFLALPINMVDIKLD